jgi:hypothetical protein
MALTPITPPTGGAATAQTVQTTSRDYIASGSCSGTAFTHEQRLTISYTMTTYPQPTGAWLPATADVSGFSLQIYANATGQRGDFSTSASDGSGCANAANMRQDQVFDISSTSIATGALGTAGMITTASAGTFRRWALATDTDFFEGNTYSRVWFPLDGLPQGFQNNVDLSKQVLRQIIYQVLDGGLEYSPDGTQASVLQMPTNTYFDRSLLRI